MPLPKNALPSSKAAERDPVERVFLSYDGLRLCADGYGEPEAPPVILLHGGGQTRHAWQETARALASAGFFALALDQRGHGDSEWSREGRYDLDSFALDLGAVARALPRPPALIGASLGGLAALLAQADPAIRAAEARSIGSTSTNDPPLSALVLVDVGPRLEMAGVARVVSFMTAHPQGFASIEQAADAIAAYLPQRRRPKDLSGLKRNLRPMSDGRFRWHWDPSFLDLDQKMNPAEFTERMFACARQIEIPTLLVRGRLSDVLSEEAAREFLTLVPHAELVDVADAAHMVAGDSNDSFSQAVVSFLTRLAT